MIQPPSEEQLAMLWWKGLAPGEQELWTGEALAEIGPDDERRGTDLPLACWRLYWSRGPQLGDRDIDRLTLGMCPVCGQRGFVIGPAQGGGERHPALKDVPPPVTLNIECAQLDCRMRYNVAFWSGTAMVGHHLGHGATAEPWPSEPRWLG